MTSEGNATVHKSSTPSIDPVTLSVVWNAMVAITEEMGVRLRNSAYSAAVREGDDFSTGLFDRHGRLVAQGNFTPGHLGAMPFVLRHVENHFPREKLRPGDGFMLNDSFMGSGHFPDCFFIMPIHDGNELVGYTATIAHQIDVGGAAAGSQMVHGVTEAYQEGIRILPVQIMRDGVFVEDVLRLILGNVRLPDVVRGDLTAQYNASRAGAAQYLTLYRRYGAVAFDALMSEILDRSEEDLSTRLRDIREGAYSFEDFLDDAGPDTSPICIALDLEVRDGRVKLDFSRSSDQVSAAINSYINYTRAYSYFAIKVLTGSTLPQNVGSTRPIEVTSRPGSFMNPNFPAASGGRAAIQVRIFEVINGALSKAVPDRVLAGFSHWSNPNIGGVHPGTKKPFIYYDLIMGGYGATAAADGLEALAPVMNCANIPIEMHEAACPIRIRSFGFIPDSGGAGQYRGGSGVQKEIEVLAESARLTQLSDRYCFAPYGLEGGQPGALGSTTLLRDGDLRSLGSKEVVDLEKGDIISFKVSGAGGYGNPRARAREAIEQDLREGYCTPSYVERFHR